MTFTTELFYEPANISVYPFSRIRLQTYCTDPSRNHWLSICWIEGINEMKLFAKKLFKMAAKIKGKMNCLELCSLRFEMFVQNI